MVGVCMSFCDDVVCSNSYIGCEYWLVMMLNF